MTAKPTSTPTPRFTLTKVKTFNGREGHGLNATICKDGKPICYVLDDASGGPTDFDYGNPGQTKESYEATTKEMADAAERELGDYCLSLLSPEDRAETKAEDAVEDWVNKTVDELATKKRFDRAAKTKTLFRLKGDKPDEWRTLSKPYNTPGLADFMKKKYGDSIEQIWGVA